MKAEKGQLARLAERLRQTRAPAIAYVDRTSWNPEIAALPAGYRVEAFVLDGSDPVALIRLSRKGLAPP